MIYRLFSLIFLLLLVALPAYAEVTVSLSGVSKELQKVLSAVLDPPSALKAEGPVSTLWLERFQKQVPALVRSALEPFGYYHAEVSVVQHVEGNKVELRVEVNPGRPVRLVERRIFPAEGSAEQPRLELEGFPLKVGDVLREDLYEQGKARLMIELEDQGFLNARFLRHELQVDRDRNQARIVLEIEPGQLTRFGEVHISGAADYPERFLRRYQAFRPGDVFSYRLLGKTQKNLRDADLFKRVMVAPRLEKSETGQVPITIELEPRPRFSLRPGIGYGTDTGARVSLRYLDRNAWQRGHQFNADLLIAERLQDLSGRYAFPGYRNLSTGLNLSSGYRAEQLDNYTSEYVFTELEQIYGFAENRVGAAFVRAQYEQTDISSDSVYTGFLMPGLRYTEARLPANTGKNYGYRLQAEGRLSDERLLSDINLVQLLGDADLYFKLPLRASLTLRGRVATTFIDDPFIEIPASLRFFAGGDRSVRGYAYQSLGPKDEAGTVIGGKHLLSGSVELGKMIGKSWGVAIFVDSGNAFDSWKDYALEIGAGAGLRFSTPVGPIQVDLATPLNQGRASVRLHIGIGFGW